MQNASMSLSDGLIAADLDCSGCGRPLIKNGQFKCLRCKPKRLVLATLGQKAIVCPRHGEPVVLMRKDPQGQYRAYCQNRSCPNHKQRIGTIIKQRRRRQEMEKTTLTEKVFNEIESLVYEVTSFGNKEHYSINIQRDGEASYPEQYWVLISVRVTNPELMARGNERRGQVGSIPLEITGFARSHSMDFALCDALENLLGQIEALKRNLY